MIIYPKFKEKQFWKKLGSKFLVNFSPFCIKKKPLSFLAQAPDH